MFKEPVLEQRGGIAVKVGVWGVSQEEDRKEGTPGAK